MAILSKVTGSLPQRSAILETPKLSRLFGNPNNTPPPCLAEDAELEAGNSAHAFIANSGAQGMAPRH